MAKTNNVLCPICCQKDLKHITDKVRFGKSADVYQCNSCSLEFLDQKSFDYPKDFYEKEYHQTYLTHVEPDALNPHSYFQKMLKTTDIWASRLKEHLKGDEVILDVGCSTGHFMKHLENNVSKIYGQELNKKEVDFCCNELSLDVSDNSIDSRFSEEMFDYITLIFVLEHIAKPESFLTDLSKYLKPNGKFAILIPNINDPLMQMYDIPDFRNFYYCIEHLYYYSPHTLKLLFDKINLKSTIEVYQEYPLANHLNWGYRKKPSDTLMAREGLPDIPLMKQSEKKDWKVFWNDINITYLEYLKKYGYGDRIWAFAGRN